MDQSDATRQRKNQYQTHLVFISKTYSLYLKTGPVKNWPKKNGYRCSRFPEFLKKRLLVTTEYLFNFPRRHFR